MIVPLAILGDISCSKTRHLFLESFGEASAECFPQKDNPNRRVFRDAKLSTVVLTATRRKTEAITGSIRVRVYPWNRFDDDHKSSQIELADLMLLDPENLPVPLVDEQSWKLCRKLHRNPRAMRLADFDNFNVTRGEINQTTFGDYITTNPAHARMLKGVEIQQFGLNEILQQGFREYLDEKKYLKAKRPVRSQAFVRRIAMQRITGVDEKLRIVATIVDPPMYFADSTNSIAKSGSGKDSDLDFLLALLNSSLMQWRFKLTSTNNNVGTNELLCLPIIKADASGPKLAERMTNWVAEMLDLHKRLPAEPHPHRREQIQREIDATDRQIDQLVY